MDIKRTDNFKLLAMEISNINTLQLHLHDINQNCIEEYRTDKHSKIVVKDSRVHNNNFIGHA